MNLLKRCALLLAPLAAAALCAVPSFAEGAVPQIVLSETGAARQYKVTLDHWDSSVNAVQFDVKLDRAVSGSNIVWSDTDSSSFYKLDEQSTDGATILTFYCDKRSPLSGSGSAVIGTLTLPEAAAGAKFTTSGYMKVLNATLEETVYNDATLRAKSYTSPSSGDSGSSGGGSYSRRAAPSDWNDVRDDIVTKNGKKTLTMDMSGDPRLSVDILQGLREENVTVELQFEGYSWSIDGSSVGNIPSDRNFYDMELEKIALQNVSRAAQGTDLVQFETGGDGELPFTAVLKWPVGAEYSGKTVCLGYYNESAGTLDYRGASSVDNQGSVKFSFHHFSKYVITSEDLWGVTVADGTKAAPGTTVLVPALEQAQAAQTVEQNEPASEPEPMQSEAPVEQPEEGQQEEARGGIPVGPSGQSAVQETGSGARIAVLCVILAAIAATAVACVVVLKRKR